MAARSATVDGTLSGQYACGENLSPTSRTKAPFSLPIELAVRGGKVSGRREDSRTFDDFSGSMDPSGQLTIDLAGQWKDEPSRRWLGRFNGQVRDEVARVPGEMLAPDGRAKVRDCFLTLKFLQRVQPTNAPDSTVPAAPARTPPSGQPPESASSKETARRESNSPAPKSQHLPQRLVERLEAFRKSVDSIGQDPARSNERLADDISETYDKSNFGNAFENNCRPLDGPYRLEQLGRMVAMRPFHWTPEMASRVEPLWGQFVAACPTNRQLGDEFLAAVRRTTEERARQVAALKASHAAKKAESEAAQARDAEQKRAARQQQEEAQRRAQADRERQDAEVRQQRVQDLKSGKIKPESLADAVLLHNARGAMTLVFSPKVGPSSEMFSVHGVLKNVIGDTLVFDVGGRLAEVRLEKGTVFLRAKFADLRLNGPIGMVGTYAGMDQSRGQAWAVFKAAYVQQ